MTIEVFTRIERTVWGIAAGGPLVFALWKAFLEWRGVHRRVRMFAARLADLAPTQRPGRGRRRPLPPPEPAKAPVPVDDVA